MDEEAEQCSDAGGDGGDDDGDGNNDGDDDDDDNGGMEEASVWFEIVERSNVQKRKPGRLLIRANLA